MVFKRHQITQDEIKQLFYYDDGALWNKVKRGNYEQDRFVGAGSKQGYIRTKINGTLFSVHRLIFCYFHGYMPEYVDHIDGDKSNNCIENLRECTVVQNGANRKPQKGGSSEYKGVYFNKNIKKWRAKIHHRVNGKMTEIHLGYYLDEKEAAKAYDKKALEMHGEFAWINFPEEKEAI